MTMTSSIILERRAPARRSASQANKNPKSVQEQRRIAILKEKNSTIKRKMAAKEERRDEIN